MNLEELTRQHRRLELYMQGSHTVYNDYVALTATHGVYLYCPNSESIYYVVALYKKLSSRLEHVRNGNLFEVDPRRISSDYRVGTGRRPGLNIEACEAAGIKVSLGSECRIEVEEDYYFHEGTIPYTRSNFPVPTLELKGSTIYVMAGSVPIAAIKEGKLIYNKDCANI